MELTYYELNIPSESSLEFCKFMFEQAKENMMKDGQLTPVSFIFTDEKAYMVELADLHLGKRETQLTLQSLAQHLKANEIIILSDVFLSYIPTDEVESGNVNLENFSPSKDPNGYEAICLMYASPGKQSTRVQKYRRENNSIQFEGPEEDMFGGMIDSKWTDKMWKDVVFQ